MACFCISTHSVSMAGRLEYVVHLEMPNHSERQAILARLLEKQQQQQQLHESTSLEAVARQTQGFTPADLSWVVREAMAARQQGGTCLTLQDLQDAVQRLRPHTLAIGPHATSSSRSTGEAEGGVAVTFSDLSGVDEAIRLLTTAILLPLKQHEAAGGGMPGVPVPVPSGVVLHGPPGTGKTKLMQALATGRLVRQTDAALGYPPSASPCPRSPSLPTTTPHLNLRFS